MSKLINYYRNNILLRWFWWLAVVIPGIPFVLFSVGFQLYAHWPRDYSDIASIAINPKTEYLSLSAHGVKDTTESWSNELQEVIKFTKNKQLFNYTKEQVSLSWQPFSDNALVCSVTGKKLGETLADKIAKLSNIKAVHLIGHSCGSFVIYGLCQKLKKINPSINVQTTYLDPVAIYSGVFWQYGVNNFGNCADFSDSYIDTKDTVPGSNENIENSYTFDVTSLRLNRNLPYSPHAWPTHFYIEAYKNQQVPLSFNNNEQRHQIYNNEVLIPWQNR